MKKIKWKILNFAFWIEMVLSYVLPFTIHNNSQYGVGFPAPFLIIYEGRMGINPFMSMHLNPLALLIDIIIIYFIIEVVMKLVYSYSVWKENKEIKRHGNIL